MRGSSLARTIEATHESLEHRLREATNHTTVRSQPRDTYARTDAFLVAVSRHLAAVDDVLVPLARRRLPDGPARADDYLRAARDLELSLALLKARMYGEAHAIHASWPRVWTDVRRRLVRHNRMERVLVDALLPVLESKEHDRLAQRVYRSEVRAPTRPHPFTPHTGIAGHVARRVWAVADRFWDAAEGRVIPEPVRPREPNNDSPMAQYPRDTPHLDREASLFHHRRRHRHRHRTP